MKKNGIIDANELFSIKIMIQNKNESSLLLYNVVLWSDNGLSPGQKREKSKIIAPSRGGIVLCIV
jgi:hypothetical protein